MFEFWSGLEISPVWRPSLSYMSIDAGEWRERRFCGLSSIGLVVDRKVPRLVLELVKIAPNKELTSSISKISAWSLPGLNIDEDSCCLCKSTYHVLVSNLSALYEITVLSPSVVTRGRWSRICCLLQTEGSSLHTFAVRSVYLIPRKVSRPQPTIWVTRRIGGACHASWVVAFMAARSSRLGSNTLGV